VTPTPPVASGSAELAADPPFASAPVEELMRVFVKAARAQQLYLPNNPIYRGAIDALRASFGNVWKETDELPLTVQETELTWYGVSVLSEGGKSSDNLAWLLFKDGVRELRLKQGIEETEIVKLLEIIQRARKAGTQDDDLITLLWEADLVHLTYRYVDLLMDGGGGTLEDGAEDAPLASPDAVRSATEAAVEESKAGGIVNMADFDGTLYFLDEKEIEYLQGEVKREYQQDLRLNVVGGLLDIFEQQPDAKIREEVLEDVETMLVYLLTAGHFRGVGYLLGETQATVGRTADLVPELRDRIARLPDRLSTKESLSQLLQALDDAPSLPAKEDLSALFDQLRPGALSTVFHWLGRIRSDALRTLLENVAGRLASMNTAELVRLVSAPEKDISSEAIRRAGALKTQAAVLALSRIVTEPDVARRQLSAQALADIASPGALQALEKIVEDPDRDVRILAARALTAKAYRPVLPRIEAIVKGKPIRESNLTEKTVFFEAYGSLCGDAGVGYLSEVLNGKGFLGRREDPELRACAALALGKIGTPKAFEALQKAGDDKEIVVRSAVSRVLRGGAGANA
jgi:hypothetical protein